MTGSYEGLIFYFIIGKLAWSLNFLNVLLGIYYTWKDESLRPFIGYIFGI